MGIVCSTLDTEVSGVLAVTEPSGKSFQSFVAAGKEERRDLVRHWICVSRLECLLAIHYL